MARETWVLGFSRTPFGAFQGALSGVPAPRLGATAIQGALKNAGATVQDVSETIMGMVLPAGVGQAPARQASLFAGISEEVPAVTVNKVCGSGMKATMLGAQSIALGESELVVAGGMENMSQAPYLLAGARTGLRMGNAPFIDSMVHDGLWDPYNNQHMGNCAELCAREKRFSREEQDAYAIESFKRAQKAWESGQLAGQVTPVVIADRKGETKVEKDEGPWKVKFDKVATLKPAFDPKGSVTAANASTINDGACALILGAAEFAKTKGLKPKARIVATATHAHKPEWFTTAPIGAIQKVCSRAGWKTDQVDLFEINEAFAVVALAAMKDLSLAASKVNVWGGAISIGHPIGASGARIVANLVHQLEVLGLKRGVAAICIGGGEATAIAVERV